MPILFAVLVVALIIHSHAINLPGRSFAKTVAVVARAPAG